MRWFPRPCEARRVSEIARVVALAALALLWANPAPADSGDENELGRWVPAFAVWFDMLGQKAEGSIEPGDVIETPAPSCGITNQDQFGCPLSPLQITPSTASSDTNIVPGVGAGLELMTPRLIEGFGSPRLFARGEAELTFGFERNLAGERKPGPFFADPLKPNETDVAEQSVGGQG